MATYKISPTGNGSDGATWATAYQTLAAAISAHTEHYSGTNSWAILV